MNRPLLPGISFDTSAAGPAGRVGAVVVDVLGTGLVVTVDRGLSLPLEQAERSTTSTVKVMSTAGETALRCIRLAVHRAAGRKGEGNRSGPNHSRGLIR